MTDKVREAAQQALEALEYDTEPEPKYGINAAITALREALAEPVQESSAATAWQEGYDQGVADERTSDVNIGISGFGAKVTPARNNPYTAPPQRKPEPVQEPYLNHCPQCGGPADNGHDRCFPPNPYFCTKCMEKLEKNT